MPHAYTIPHIPPHIGGMMIISPMMRDNLPLSLIGGLIGIIPLFLSPYSPFPLIVGCGSKGKGIIHPLRDLSELKTTRPRRGREKAENSPPPYPRSRFAQRRRDEEATTPHPVGSGGGKGATPDAHPHFVFCGDGLRHSGGYAVEGGTAIRTMGGLVW